MRAVNSKRKTAKTNFEPEAVEEKEAEQEDARRELGVLLQNLAGDEEARPRMALEKAKEEKLRPTKNKLVSK